MLRSRRQGSSQCLYTIWHLSHVTVRNSQAAKWAIKAGDSSEEVSPGLPELARDLGEHQLNIKQIVTGKHTGSERA